MTRLVNAGGHIYRETEDEKVVADYIAQGYTVVDNDGTAVTEDVPEFVIENEEGG